MDKENVALYFIQLSYVKVQSEVQDVISYQQQ